MKRRAGQAGLIIAEAIHQLGRILLLLLLLLLLGVCALGLRLSRGPIELPVLASWLATAVSGEGIQITMQQADLAWAGYHQGGGVPLYLRLGDISVRNAENLVLVSIPSARLAVAPSALFGGRAPVLVSGAGARFNGSNVPVSLQAALRLARGFVLASADIQVSLGAGSLGAGKMTLPISAGGFALLITPTSAVLSRGVLRLAASGASAPVLNVTGTAAFDKIWRAQIRVRGTSVQAPDLHVYWPRALIPKTRDWVLHNIRSGTASGSNFTFSLTAPPTLARLALADVTGGFDGRGLTLQWLPKAVPITGLSGRFQMPDRDNVLVTARSAALAGLTLDRGSFRITGVSTPDQTGHLDVALHGALAAALGLLDAPPINLLRHAPLQIAEARGEVTATLSANIPLRPDITLPDTDLRVEADLHDVTLPAMLPGVGFTAGELTLHATGTQLRLYGGARFAGAQARVSLRAALGGQAGLRDFTMTGAAGPALLAALGLGGGSPMMITGGGALPFMIQISPGGGADAGQMAAVIMDLTPATLAIPRLGWAKPAGVAGRVDLHAAIRNGAVSALRDVLVSAPGLRIRAQASGARLIIAQADIGQTRAQGSLTPPAQPGSPWIAEFSGPMLDFRVLPGVAPHAGTRPTPERAVTPGGAEWRLSLNFVHLALSPAPAPPLSALVLTAAGQGGAVRAVQAEAGGDSLSLGPQSGGGGTKLSLLAADGGALLQALGLSHNIQGGALSLAAAYAPEAPTAGVLTLTGFRLLNAPEFTKILQAATIYGAAAATSGPGMAFERATIPFSLTPDALILNGARAFSTSLGFTASGSLSLTSDDIDLDCTIIPAYALNALPGKIPVVGHLFTAEAGGGLFAVRARVTGTRTNPQISVNPLSALTPGVLRDVFGVSGAK